MADVIAKMSYMYFNHQCWFDMADVIAKWQMD